jgi:molecular chaperone HtpG
MVALFGSGPARRRSAMSAETLSFQAEVSRLLDIVANSLYSHKEIFLRELISNASDACDRLRYAAIAHPDLIAEDPEFKIRITAEKAGRRLTIADNGIGMNRDELVENLGTIARSGTAAFVAQLEDAEADVSQIGQFGVGFYSAFMVADSVEVTSRKAGEDQVWCWRSDGKGSFEVSESDRELARGTEIALTLKKGEEGFLAPEEIRRIVTTYSDHIAIPIVLADKATGAGETLNQASALWTRPKSEISEEQYREFYHHVSHGFDDPWLHLHFKAEGVIEYSGLLFVPASRPFDLFHPERQHHVKLYVKRVFITDDCAGLVPPYLRFLRGVIDSEDLPLNVSREMLQANPVIAKIRKAVVKRVLGELKRKAEQAPDDYAVFWKNFGAVVKEGLYEDEAQRAAILELARFQSTAAPGEEPGGAPGTEAGTEAGKPAAGGGLIGLKDYVARMREGQEAIYYISGDAPDSLRRSPQLEGFRAKGVEVLLLTDPVDDFWLSVVPAYDDKPFKSVTRGAADLDGIEAQRPGDEDQAGAARETPGEAGELDSLIAFVKLTLKDKVKDVRLSKRLTESPVCLVADEGDLDMHLERVLKQHHQIDRASQRILEVNPGHPLIRGLAERVAAGGSAADLEDAARLLLDQALILEGESPPDPVAFTRRLSHLVARGLAGG